MVAGHGHSGRRLVGKRERFGIGVPLRIGVVVDIVAEIDDEIRLRNQRKPRPQGFGGMPKVFDAACLNVGNGQERERFVAVVGSERADVAPKAVCTVADTVHIGGTGFQIGDGDLMGIPVAVSFCFTAVTQRV